MGLGLLAMGEVVRGPQEAAGERDEQALRVRRVAAIEAGLDDLLHAPDVHELEDKRPAAGGVEPGVAVALADPQQLLSLA